jgi:hypothetical protein
MLNDTNAEKIRSLNDSFRRNLVFGGTVLLTPGVTSLEIDRQATLLEAVRKFSFHLSGVERERSAVME